MADKMMRIAGRNKDGLAKAIKLSEANNLVIEKDYYVLMDEDVTTRTLETGESWRSDSLDVRGKDKLFYRLTLNKQTNITFTVRHKVTAAATAYDVLTIIPKEVRTGAISGEFNLRSPYIVFEVKNEGSEPVNVGMYATAK